MKYLCLIYQDEDAMNSLPPGEWRALMEECASHTQSLLQNQHFVDGNILASVHSATTIKARQNKLLTTDGPFAETKEQLAGYCLVEARDLNEAIQLASKLPPIRYGSVEVRPVREDIYDRSAYR